MMMRVWYHEITNTFVKFLPSQKRAAPLQVRTTKPLQQLMAEADSAVAREKKKLQ